MRFSHTQCLFLLRSVFTLTVVAASTAKPALAEPVFGWNLSGFGSLGVVSQSGGHGWGFVRSSGQLGADSDAGVTPDSRLGLQLNWTVGSQWEGGVQGVLLRRPAGTPAEESVEWAYLGYRPWPNTRVRLGRTSPDIFLFADSRNVGFAFPWARPPVDFYGFAPLTSIDGADLEQRWFSGESTWRARLTAGTFKSSVRSASGTDVNGNDSRLTMQGRDTWALGLSREEGGFLMKFSYLRSRLQVDTGGAVVQLRQGLDQLAALPLPGIANAVDPLRGNLWTGGIASYFALAAQYDTGPWTFIAEGSQLRVPRSPLNARRAYLSVGYRQGLITYYGVAGRVRPDKDAAAEPALAASLTPILGAQGAQQAQVLASYAAAAGYNSRFDQSTIGVGLRWDFAPNAALKFQVDQFDVRRHGGAGWRFSDGRAARGVLVTVLVDFIWGQ